MGSESEAKYTRLREIVASFEADTSSVDCAPDTSIPARSGSTVVMGVFDLRELLQERDAAVAACKAALPEIRCLYTQLTKEYDPRGSVKRAVDMLKAAIAAAEQGDAEGSPETTK